MNSIKLAFRILSKNRTYAFITILGLTLAIASSFILYNYIRSELSFDQHYADHENIFRVLVESTTGGGTERLSIAASALAPLFKKAHPEMVEYVRMTPPARTIFIDENSEPHIAQVIKVDDNFFDVFRHTIVLGNRSKALSEPSSIAISENFAREAFGNRNPIGEHLSSYPFEYRVMVVFKDIPENTHVKYSAVISMKQDQLQGEPAVENILYMIFDLGLYTYFKTKSGFTESDFEAALNRFYKDEAEEIASQYDIALRYLTQPLKDTHFEAGWDFDQPVGSIFYVYAFLAVAIFLVLIACINYTNLATALASRRSKEISMRKILGSGRFRLFARFMCESTLYSLAALVFGLLLVSVLDAFGGVNQLLGRSSLYGLGDFSIVMFLILLVLTVAVIAGSYPALYLSSVDPKYSLSGSGGRPRGYYLRQLLVFGQFCISVCVLAATFVMVLQMDFIDSKAKGYNAKDKLVVKLQGADTLMRLDVIKDRLLLDSDVLGVAESSYVPGGSVNPTFAFIEDSVGEQNQQAVGRIEVSHEFVDVMGIEMVKGRPLSDQLLTDQRKSILVNESLSQFMGWDQPIGRKLSWADNQAEVVGVVKDFHFSSLHQKIEPLFLTLRQPINFQNMLEFRRSLVSRDIIVDISPSNQESTIKYIESVIAEFDPNRLVEYEFFDNLLENQYTSEANLVALTMILALMCLFLSCMGLFGLATFTAEQRKKEMGIRKVLGATEGQIVYLLVKNVLWLCLVASLIGSLASFLVIENWLDMFAYRIMIGPWPFILASLVVVIVSVITVAAQSHVTVRSSPITALRDE